MGNQAPELEIKLNSQHYDFVQVEENEEDRVILMQFEEDRELVYICLNGNQVFVPVKELKVAVDAMQENKEKSLQDEITKLQLELKKQKLENEANKKKEGK